jgi:short-subunit dehydrogenase
MKVVGKVLVVTGAGSGIGRAVVLEAIRRGAKVAAVDVQKKTVEETASLAAAPGRVSTHVVDVSNKAAVAALPVEVAAQLGPVDGLIHCAGIIQPFVKLTQLEDAAIERVFNVNWWGTLYLTRAFLPLLLGRPEGHLVHVSSMGGFLPVPGQTIYGATKAAVKLFTEALFAECAGTNVRVTVVLPGGVATNITTNSGVAMPAGASTTEAPMSLTTAEEAARNILDGMERNAYRVLIGKDAKMMDALYRLAPRRATELIARQMKALLGV